MHFSAVVVAALVAVVAAQSTDVPSTVAPSMTATTDAPVATATGAAAPDLITLLTGVNSDNSTAPFRLKALFAAVLSTNLTSDLLAATKGPVTIFAPTDVAFNKTATALANATAADVANILRYHLVAGSAYAPTADTPRTILHSISTSALLGANQTYSIVADSAVKDDGSVGAVLNAQSANASVIASFAIANGGIVHIIDSVLTLPPKTSDVAAAANLTSLATALTAVSAVDTVNTVPGVTIFAPRNAAFDALKSKNMTLSLSMILAVLEYHVVPGIYFSTDIAALLKSGSINVTTVNGDKLFVKKSDTGIALSTTGNSTANVIAADILIANGVVHLIDAVLVPNNTTPVPLAGPAASTSTAAVAASTSASVVASTPAAPAPAASSKPATTTSSAAKNVAGFAAAAVAVAALFL